MANRDDEFRRGVERPQFSAYDGTGDEHGEPREYHYGSGFEKPERGLDVQGAESRSGTGFLRENRETGRARPR
jgi:hypothetical protein